MLYYCRECGAQLAPDSKFCPNCGKVVLAYQEPEPMGGEPVSRPVEPGWEPVTPAVPVKAKVFGFVGMGLSIAGVFFAAIGLLMTLVSVGVEGLGFAMAIAYGLVSAPFSITGLVLSTKGKGLGFRGAAATAGVSLGIVSIGLIVISLLVGMIGLA